MHENPAKEQRKSHRRDLNDPTEGATGDALDGGNHGLTLDSVEVVVIGAVPRVTAARPSRHIDAAISAIDAALDGA